MISKRLREAFKFHREFGTQVIGKHAINAIRAARAEQWLKQYSNKLVIKWEFDKFADRGPVDWGWPQDAIDRWKKQDHTVESLTITHKPTGELVHIGGCWDFDANDKRVYEADLAIELMEFFYL